MHDEGDRKMEAVLARAQAAVADLAKHYGANTLGDLDQCAALLKTAREAPDRRAAAIKDLYGIAHNIKGQGGSFGYPLVTRIGHSLCTLVRQEREFSDADLGVVQAHLDALRLILTKDIKGEGGEVGARLAARLENMVKAPG
ncbi:Hpt domain-containing protein [Dongia sedimenti]|uniref:Hpt domain-containing protein n=1 Tax=Dongia sedimenti TaxID=3064282 RepID=A0ABU0YPY3_9PROT|nr:Hpt domain-containing protein [Rhodospirillaceae bacterium R-7]